MKKIFIFIIFCMFAYGAQADEQLTTIINELKTLNKDLKTLEKAVYSKSFSSQNSTNSSSGNIPATLEGALTRQLVKLSELEEQIQKMTASNEETLFNLQKISERVDKIQRDTELRFSDLGSGSTSTTSVQKTNTPKQLPGTGKMQDFSKVLDTPSNDTKIASNQKQEIRSISPAAVVQTADVEAESILPKGTPASQYKFATNFIKVGDYQKAEIALKEFIEKNPTHSLSGSAQYWFAETFYIRQLYHDAAAAYLDGYQKFPKSKKAPQNLLKLGIVMNELGEKDQGCLMLSGVKKQYPKADKSILQKAKYETKKFKCAKS
ncbi:TPR repeat containing exported protein; Putative periplasmic protein contains a protein prenylyltransferase domain [Candidatus Pelagibacter sp. IMCC9063]|jgi:tol-pal system protein YbgF|uniref:tol-pal system protein YbgF n=1 Tax=Pelagibacter sp. (strain IMCC9063) TaxID=1002672 RepID=UPI0002046596|nr:tol-pal system protein YbgF [Candidatus Pelagibacter sp. IMCC9063]AEA81892.1 TPR repeat containing exported protein; Putative periplasmic protein contains a protein prenylyltransferase domain [Candidatus Pelagibacter sp. IMCC9063]